MACEQSEVSIGVSGAMSWITGEFGLIQRVQRNNSGGGVKSAPRWSAAPGGESSSSDDWPDETRRSLSEAGFYEEPDLEYEDAEYTSDGRYPIELYRLCDQLATFAIAMSVLMTIQMGGIYIWKHRCERWSLPHTVIHMWIYHICIHIWKHMCQRWSQPRPSPHLDAERAGATGSTTQRFVRCMSNWDPARKLRCRARHTIRSWS